MPVPPGPTGRRGRRTDLLLLRPGRHAAGVRRGRPAVRLDRGRPGRRGSRARSRRARRGPGSTTSRSPCTTARPPPTSTAPLGFSFIGTIEQPHDPRGFSIGYLKSGDTVLEVFTYDSAKQRPGAAARRARLPVRPADVATDPGRGAPVGSDGEPIGGRRPERVRVRRRRDGPDAVTAPDGNDWLRPLGCTGLRVTAVAVGGAPLGSMPENFGHEVSARRGYRPRRVRPGLAASGTRHRPTATAAARASAGSARHRPPRRAARRLPGHHQGRRPRPGLLRRPGPRQHRRVPSSGWPGSPAAGATCTILNSTTSTTWPAPAGRSRR